MDTLDFLNVKNPWGFAALIFVVIIIFSAFLASVTPQGKPDHNSSFLDTREILVIEGCEYFKVPAHGFTYTLTHKGNCTNVSAHVATIK